MTPAPSAGGKAVDEQREGRAVVRLRPRRDEGVRANGTERTRATIFVSGSARNDGLDASWNGSP